MADAHDRLGRVMAEQGKKAEAGASRREASRLREMAVVENNRGIELADDGKPDEAIAAFRKAIRIQPTFAEARANLGAALLGWEDMGAAMAELAEAIRIEPTLAAAHVNLGIALKRQGADRAAVPAFAEAVRLQQGIDTSRRCWARASAPARSEPSRRFPALRRDPRPKAGRSRMKSTGPLTDRDRRHETDETQRGWPLAARGLRWTRRRTRSDGSATAAPAFPPAWMELIDGPSPGKSIGLIGPYRIDRRIGRGGMGVVFQAYDSALRRVVAIKFLSPRLAVSPLARLRFAREAQAAAAINHP